MVFVRLVRRLGVVAVPMLGAVLLAGCGSGAAPAPTPVEVVQNSYAKTVAAGSARMDFQASTQAAGSRPVATGNGALDFSRQAFDLSLTIPGLAQPIHAVGLGANAYLNAPMLTSRIPGGGAWLLIEPERLQQTNNPVAAQFAGSVDSPLGQFALVQGAGPDTRLVGPEVIDGTPTSHYATTIDFNLAVQRAPDPATGRALRSYQQKAGANAPAGSRSAGSPQSSMREPITTVRSSGSLK